jgi:hypothetical protein
MFKRKNSDPDFTSPEERERHKKIKDRYIDRSD